MPWKDPRKKQEYTNRYNRNRSAVRLHAAIKKLGGRCVACGSFEELQFDHIDPKTKEFNLVKCAHSVSDVRWAAEVAKCQLLCFPCHIIKTNCDRRGEEFKTLDPWDLEEQEKDFDMLWA